MSLQAIDGMPMTRFFINVLSLGLTAEAAELVNRRRKKVGGKWTYLNAAIATILRHKPISIKTSGNANAHNFSGNVTAAVIARGKYFGGGVLISPNSEPFGSDAQFVVLKAQPKWRLLLKSLPAVYSGTHLRSSEFLQTTCRQLLISTNERTPVLVEADGEVIGKLPLQLTGRQVTLLCSVPE